MNLQTIRQASLWEMIENIIDAEPNTGFPLYGPFLIKINLNLTILPGLNMQDDFTEVSLWSNLLCDFEFPACHICNLLQHSSYKRT